MECSGKETTYISIAYQQMPAYGSTHHLVQYDMQQILQEIHKTRYYN